MAATKALDDLFHVEPTPAARKIREIFYNLFTLEDHTLHFFFLGGPDFVVGPTAPKAERNILGVIGKVGLEIGGKVIRLRRECRDWMNYIGGKVIHPVLGLPGGVAKRIEEEKRKEIVKTADYAVEFTQFAMEIFNDVVLKNEEYVKVVTGDIYKMQSYYMGLVDKNNKVNFYDGDLRVVSPEGKEFVKFHPKDYLDHISEHVEPWTYMKFTFLKKVGWNGFTEGADSGIYRVAPLARLNASDGMATPIAQKEYDRMYEILGGKPVHHTLAFHWARLIESIQAAEAIQILANDPEICSEKIRNIPTKTPDEGIGCVEAPRGSLIHHYKTDARGIIEEANLIVATQNNLSAMTMSISKAAKALIKNGQVNDGLLNMVEMAFRPYDPCHACGTHCLPGETPLVINIYNEKKELLRKIKRD